MTARPSYLIIPLSFLAAVAATVGIRSTATASTPPPQSIPTPVELVYGPTPDVESVAATLVDVYLSTTTTTVAVQRPATRMTPPVMPGGDAWDQLAACETGGNWAANTGNGFGGGVQFAHGPGWSTWRAFGGEEFAADPWDATREEQIVVAERVLARSGWGAWPGCSRKFGWL